MRKYLKLRSLKAAVLAAAFMMAKSIAFATPERTAIPMTEIPETVDSLLYNSSKCMPSLLRGRRKKRL